MVGFLIYQPQKVKSAGQIWVNVFKNGPSKICGRQPLKNFTWTILEYLALTHLSLQQIANFIYYIVLDSNYSISQNVERTEINLVTSNNLYFLSCKLWLKHWFTDIFWMWIYFKENLWILSAEFENKRNFSLFLIINSSFFVRGNIIDSCHSNLAQIPKFSAIREFHNICWGIIKWCYKFYRTIFIINESWTKGLL